MIVVFSTLNDGSTQEVCKWLKYYQKDYRIIYCSDFFDNLNSSGISRKDFLKWFEVFAEIRISDVTIFWCRKWNISAIAHKHLAGIKIDQVELTKLFNCYVNELSIIWNHFLDLLPQDKIFSHFRKSNPSKLKQLLYAEEIGLKIPLSFITNEIKCIQKFLKKNKGITKAIYEPIGLKDNNQSYSSLTSEITEENIQNLSIIPSLIQEKIQKKYELRIFFIENIFYATAIFSQLNPKTKIDFRRYDYNDPNRLIPYEIPSSIKKKLIAYNSKLNLQTGSFDFIVNDKNEFIFLEVNPFGQFGMVSKPNNFNIEKIIAEYLINYGNVKKEV